MTETRPEYISRKQSVIGWVATAIPRIEQALLKSRHKAKNPNGDPFSMNLCDELGSAIPQEELKSFGIEGNKLFGVEAAGKSAIHVGFYDAKDNLVIDPTSGQWGDPEGHQLTELIRKYPDLFVGRILVATPQDIKEKLGWEYKVL